jgi:formamidopyrimidine-DNA glycosylase
LGPDALSATAADLIVRLGASRRAIKVALLDQRSIAGIGNLYASEILHVARLHPARLCRRLTQSEWHRLAAAIHEVLTEAIRYEGSTLSDGTYRTALNDPGRYQNQHRVYGRAGEDCPTCGRGTVVRVVQAQRSTFYCPLCQRR